MTAAKGVLVSTAAPRTGPGEEDREGSERGVPPGEEHEGGQDHPGAGHGHGEGAQEGGQEPRAEAAGHRGEHRGAGRGAAGAGEKC